MRLGLLAAAKITDQAIIDVVSDVDGVEVVAVAARDLGRAQDAAERWGLPTAYGSYSELLADDTIDAVYIATPAGLHHRWTLAALAAGKHVLCEKPFASNANQAAEMVAAGEAAFASEGLILMEAYHWRYHPLAEQMRTIVDSGELGKVERVEAHFNLPDGAIPRSDIRWDLAIGGGATMDLGCYPIQWTRFIMGADPTVVSATAECPVEGVDGKLTAELVWGDEVHGGRVTGMVESSMIDEGDPVLDLVVTGSEGTMTVFNPLAPHMGALLTVVVGDETRTEDVATTATYFHQLVAFRDAISSRTKPLTGGEDALATMAIIDACYRAAGLEPRPSLP